MDSNSPNVLWLAHGPTVGVVSFKSEVRGGLTELCMKPIGTSSISLSTDKMKLNSKCMKLKPFKNFYVGFNDRLHKST